MDARGIGQNMVFIGHKVVWIGQIQLAFCPIDVYTMTIDYQKLGQK
jgi:hypothetical protein